MRVPPDIRMLNQDWGTYYAKDKMYRLVWAEMKIAEYVDDPKREACFHKGKVRPRGQKEETMVLQFCSFQLLK